MIFVRNCNHIYSCRKWKREREDSVKIQSDKNFKTHYHCIRMTFICFILVLIWETSVSSWTKSFEECLWNSLERARVQLKGTSYSNLNSNYFKLDSVYNPTICSSRDHDCNEWPLVTQLVSSVIQLNYLASHSPPSLILFRSTRGHWSSSILPVK